MVSPKTLMQLCDKCGSKYLEENGVLVCSECGLEHLFSVRRSEDCVFRVCNLFIENKNIAKRIKENYGLDLFVYEKTLQLLCFAMLKKVPFQERGNISSFHLTVATAYVADNLFSKKANNTPVLTQKLVAEITKITKRSIRKSSKFLLKYEFEEIIFEMCKRLNWIEEEEELYKIPI